MLDSFASVFRVLGDPTRLEMLGLLRIRDICVCEFVQLFDLSQPSISQHLHRLKEAGLVTGHRRGMWVLYRLAEDLPPVVTAALDALPRPLPREERLRAMDSDMVCAAVSGMGR
ncbi:MAG: metalloregulator ArsR/SmtB family transcription factor [Peptococcaceae bacterium]|nr:metalloregulator ArsR/SmtB family transcription factor [Peptococcaceae bacterium]